MSRYYPTIEPRALAPLRPSGPEPIDPGRMPSWDKQAYRADPFAQPVGAIEVKEGGMWDRLLQEDKEENPEPSRPFGLSRNEQRLAIIGGVALVGFLLLRKK